MTASDQPPRTTRGNPDSGASPRRTNRRR
jgi:hypothetical protein